LTTNTSTPRVQMRRVPEVPGGGDATYRQHGDTVTILIRDDLITERGASVMAELCETALRLHWRPKTTLRLVQGGAL
jgi:hypothetical protein